MFFKQTNLKISIPLYIKTVNVLDDYPLAKFKLEDLRVRPGQKYEYSLKQNVSWLDLDQKGYLRFTYGAPKSTKNIPVLVKKSFGNKTRRAKANISVEMYQITSDKDVQNFCENRLCFWDNIQYRMLEGVYISNRTELIGDLAPHIYQHFCPNYSVEYKLWNASHLININGGKMYATGDWNYDLQNSPLHRLQPSVGCHINTKDGKWRKVITKTLDIIVVDLNDSPIEFVENKTVTEFGRKVDTFVKARIFKCNTLLFY